MKRRRRRCNDGGNKKQKKNKDTFNDLPDCILLHILSFLDTKQAVQTCILSTRWKDLWKCVPTLTLSSSSYPDSVFSQNLKGFGRFVSCILSKRDASIALHAVTFQRTGIVEPHLLKRIVEYAVSHNVQQLRIHVKCDIQHFPSCFYSCHTLTSLDLYVGPRTYNQITLFPNSLKLPALTSLSLHQFVFPVGDDGRVEPFSTFNRLNSLIINNCIILDAQNLCISSVTLANLTIQSEYRRVNYHEIELSTPSLCTFAFTGLPFPKLSGNHLCSVKHANIDAYTYFNYTKKELTGIRPSVLLSWLIQLTHVRSLIVSSTTLQVLSIVPDLLKLKLPSLCNLKSLKIKTKLVSPQLSDALIAAKLAQQPTMSQEEVAKLQEAFKRGPLSIRDGIVDFLLQNSPAAEVHIIK